jgi:hypothetical protein
MQRSDARRVRGVLPVHLRGDLHSLWIYRDNGVQGRPLAIVGSDAIQKELRQLRAGQLSGSEGLVDACNSGFLEAK